MYKLQQKGRQRKTCFQNQWESNRKCKVLQIPFTSFRIHISNNNCSLQWALRDLSVKANRAIFRLKTNLNLMKMPIQLLLKIYDTMVVPILLYGAEVWAASCKFTPDKREKTEI